MPISEEQIEQVVRGVLARLGRVDRASGATAPVAGSASVVGELSLDDAVVTVDSVNGRLDGVRRLVVRSQAVVTPAVRDLLKDKGVVLVRGRQLEDKATSQALLAVSDAKCDAEGLAMSLQRRGIAMEQLPAADFMETTKQMATAVATNNKLGVLLTPHTLAAVCLANRHRRVRAASVANRAEVQKCIAAIGANLIAIDPIDLGQFALQQMIETFCSAGERKYPPALND